MHERKRRSSAVTPSSLPPFLPFPLPFNLTSRTHRGVATPENSEMVAVGAAFGIPWRNVAEEFGFVGKPTEGSFLAELRWRSSGGLERVLMFGDLVVLVFVSCLYTA